MMDHRSEYLLTNVQSGGLESLQAFISSVAALWMAAGCVDQANRLLTLWFEVGDALAELPGADDDPWQRGDTPFQRHPPALNGFEIAWALTGTRPGRAPTPAPSFEDIEHALWRALFSPVHAEEYVERVKSTAPDKLSPNDLWVRAKTLAYDESRPDHTASPERLTEALALLDASGPITFSRYDAGMCQAVLAARLGDEERVGTYLVNLAQIDNIRSPTLMDRTIARIALSGVLAPVCRITPQACDEDARAIEDAWRERRKLGRFVHGPLSWAQLLRTLGRAHHVKFERKRAAAAAIKAAEKRLGVALPQSYRAFLKVKNGLEKYDWAGVEVLPVGQIAWLRDADKGLIDACSSHPELSDITCKLRASLLIGSEPEGSERLLLVPADDQAAEWECWFHAHWVPGAQRHRTFRAFIESQLQRHPD
jgi:SMI1 / KNR4 family (SUKH-1)